MHTPAGWKGVYGTLRQAAPTAHSRRYEPWLTMASVSLLLMTWRWEAGGGGGGGGGGGWGGGWGGGGLHHTGVFGKMKGIAQAPLGNWGCSPSQAQ